jgi:DNA-3-methyladenine glycosylase
MVSPRLGLRASRAALMPRSESLDRRFFARSVHAVAPDLIGATLLYRGVGGIVVEVEAYHQTDPAAHSYRGRTPRNGVMFGPPGYAYVYRSYGIHWCLNFVCEAEGMASAVLIRALQPTEGIAIMRRRRRVKDERLLCAGPPSPASRTGLRWRARCSSCGRGLVFRKSRSVRASASASQPSTRGAMVFTARPT